MQFTAKIVLIIRFLPQPPQRLAPSSVWEILDPPLIKFELDSDLKIINSKSLGCNIFAGSLESANSSILAARRHFKEVVGEKIRIL